MPIRPIEAVFKDLNRLLEEALDAYPTETIGNLSTTIAQVDPLRMDAGYLISLLSDEESAAEQPRLREIILGRIRAADPEDLARFRLVLAKSAPWLCKEIFEGIDA